MAAASGKLNGAPHKLEELAKFHVGDTVTGLQRAEMQAGGQEVRSGKAAGAAGSWLALCVRGAPVSWRGVACTAGRAAWRLTGCV